MQRPSVFIDKVHAWLHNYSYIFRDPSESTVSLPFLYSPDCMRAMRDFSANIYPLATDKAKKDPYWYKVQEAVDFFTIAPDDYLAQFSSFYYLVKHSLPLWE